MNRTNFHKLLFNFLRQISGFKDLCGLVFLPQIKGLKRFRFLFATNYTNLHELLFQVLVIL
jgi:hypothetical protein